MDQKVFLDKVSQCRKLSQCRKRVIPYLYTLKRTLAHAYTLPKAFTYLNTCIPILIHALPLLIHWLGFRLSAPYLKTLNRHDLSRQPRAPKNPRLSAANQNRLLRHPRRITSLSCQPIRFEHYVTRVVTRDLSAPGRPFSALSLIRLAIAYLNTQGLPPPSPPPD